jgi:hypothetical protein
MNPNDKKFKFVKATKEGKDINKEVQKIKKKIK